MVLNGQQQEQLNEALRAAFTLTKLDAMLLYRLNRNREDYGLGGDYRDIAFRLINAANMEGWSLALLAAARESNPNNPNLFAVAEQFHLTSLPAGQVAANFESRLRAANIFLDIALWRERLGEIEPRVCRVEFNLPAEGRIVANGTGFLVASGAVLTNYHVIKPVLDGRIAVQDVILRFDYKRSADGTTLNPGTEFRLTDDGNWLIDKSPFSSIDEVPFNSTNSSPPPDQLDYAILQAAGDPGNQPVGGTKAAPGDPPRGWIKLPTAAYDYQPNAPLFIVQHPEGEPLKLAFDTDAIIGVNQNKTRVRYKTNTERGSSGSPCFDINWNLIALHHSGEPNFYSTYNQGIPIENVRRLMGERGKDGILG